MFTWYCSTLGDCCCCSLLQPCSLANGFSLCYPTFPLLYPILIQPTLATLAIHDFPPYYTYRNYSCLGTPLGAVWLDGEVGVTFLPCSFPQSLYPLIPHHPLPAVLVLPMPRVPSVIWAPPPAPSRSECCCGSVHSSKMWNWVSITSNGSNQLCRPSTKGLDTNPSSHCLYIANINWSNQLHISLHDH